MSRREKLLEQVRNNPRGVSFDDLAKLLKWHGFELRRVKGSHHIFKRGSSSIIVVYRKSHVHPKAVKETLALIDALGEDM